MERIVRLLYSGQYSCIVENFDEIFTFSQHGIADLYDMIKNKHGFLNKSFVADKVVGKGAAALMILGEVEKVYADVISLSALIMLREFAVEVDFVKAVPFIYNKDRTDWCTLEKLCYEESSPSIIFSIIEKLRNKSELEFLTPCEYNCKYPLY